ncbi:EAL domain-containing protein [Anaerovorax odorimutans]|uniref:EAL domain-containing protein n=1 Tax=Anaerovorax odorimutans TaxID=109327 RepID=A0ABT1RL82_9FIRM|nr:EAL domain-containing protein [Anaerovorax odorimutans]MCQ4635946.1 EAL domain-containing protein [Anaerovorax odorimutans]
MHWNIAAECISLVYLFIIWFYSRKSNLVPSLKNRLFYFCFLATFCAIGFNILSTVMLTYPNYSVNFLTWLVTTIYFIATPLMGMAYFFYTIATVFESQGNALRIMKWSSIPGVLYLFVVLINPFCKKLFLINAAGNYSQGPLIMTTYLIFYIYCLAAICVAFVRRAQVDPVIRKILTAFPVIAVLVIIVQQLYPEVILSGSAATCALLIIYLYLQNKQNSTDYLTGLPNRQEMLKMLELQTKKSRNFTIIVLSLRKFRRINDTYGQHTGDRFLREIGKFLEKTAKPRGLYRYGGDEFALIFRDASEDSIRGTVATLKKRMQESWTIDENSCLIPAVIGIVRYPESAETVEDLINGIEYAVVQAKKSKNTNVYYCGQEMLDAVRRRTEIVRILEKNLEENSFSLFYQPIISNHTGKYVAAESLLRIPDSPLGPLYPNEFIPIAEDTGNIVEMTYQVLEKACLFINRVTEKVPEFEGVHVNFSGHMFSQMDLADRVEEIIARNKTPFPKIKIEITESILAENTKIVEEFADRMQRRGVLLELDDFGTGYSNFVSVMTTPLDTVKLDKSLIWASMDNRQSAMMVKSMTGIFHEMGLQVLAEGVETEAQERFVCQCGIDLIQGFLFAKPMPEEDALAWILEG